MLFSHHNVFSDPPFSNLDLVVCRNVLIYLRPAVQQRICRLFSFALRVGGLLWLGPSESAPDKEKNYELRLEPLENLRAPSSDRTFHIRF